MAPTHKSGMHGCIEREQYGLESALVAPKQALTFGVWVFSVLISLLSMKTKEKMTGDFMCLGPPPLMYFVS